MPRGPLPAICAALRLPYPLLSSASCQFDVRTPRGPAHHANAVFFERRLLASGGRPSTRVTYRLGGKRMPAPLRVASWTAPRLALERHPKTWAATSARVPGPRPGRRGTPSPRALGPRDLRRHWRGLGFRRSPHGGSAGERRARRRPAGATASSCDWLRPLFSRRFRRGAVDARFPITGDPHSPRPWPHSNEGGPVVFVTGARQSGAETRSET